MAAEWCEFDPPIHLALGDQGHILLKVFVITPTVATMHQAKHDATISAAYDAVADMVTVIVAGVRSLFRVRVEVPKLDFSEVAPDDLANAEAAFYPTETATLHIPHLGQLLAQLKDEHHHGEA